MGYNYYHRKLYKGRCIDLETKFSVSLSKIIKELSLDVAYMPNNPDEIQIYSKDITRPGLELTGFLDFFDNSRIMLFGNTENSYLNRFSTEQRYHVIERLFSLNPPAIIVTRSIIPYGELMSAAEKCKIHSRSRYQNQTRILFRKVLIRSM